MNPSRRIDTNFHCSFVFLKNVIPIDAQSQTRASAQDHVVHRLWVLLLLMSFLLHVMHDNESLKVIIFYKHKKGNLQKILRPWLISFLCPLHLFLVGVKDFPFFSLGRGQCCSRGLNQWSLAIAFLVRWRYISIWTGLSGLGQAAIDLIHGPLLRAILV